MFYHSPQFLEIADQAAAFARPLILAQIKELSTDFIKQFPEVTNINASTGNIMMLDKNGEHVRTPARHTLKNPLWLFLRDITTKDLIGFCPDITLQPGLLIDGIPIEEAIQKAETVNFVVLYRFTNEYDDDCTEVLYSGNDRATADRIADESETLSGTVEFQEWRNGVNTYNDYK